ncbi:FixH family protein [Sphaerobacter thermophilus]|uniref:YtkA-like domain-containing protein n=1 Tax=Sphaerobacter thermophilus (strain ATCC 49802 / DSM 20745 / KCCM 41009 / NCIMB 13125 / S 6022) TaxID=479434 RepID=D1C6E0_SPHTD|nr:FixH family protein [Sphaerobacter thermophilus]ACZ37678.1 hypothetical protein Sthe_0239 [Sphaerobacter thermophilus DSM 20745]
MRQFSRGLVLLAVVAVLTVGVACGRSASSEAPSNYQVTLAVEPSPAAVGPATVTVTIRDQDNAPVTGATVEVEGNMSHAGMKPVFADAHHQGDGQYVTEGFEFTMGGDWILTARVTLADGTSFEHSEDLPGVHGDDKHNGDHGDHDDHEDAGH